MPDSRPQLIAERYRLVSQIGQGGMGRVWAARDELLGRDVAIKELVPPAGLGEAELHALRERVIREARAIAMLDQPNVVRIFDVVFQQGDPWLVMELVLSRSLFDTVRDEGPMAPDRAARVGLGVLAALRAAHRVGLLHRDVKPGNVLLAHDGRVVLTDFGLATAVGDSSMTHTGIVLGSPQYLAPERALDGEIGPPADLWALGATLYAAVEGRPPYVRSSPMATLAALATELPPPPEQAGTLRYALTALLQRDPADRADAETAQRLLLAATTAGAPPPEDLPVYRRPTFTAPIPIASAAPAPAEPAPAGPGPAELPGAELPEAEPGGVESGPAEAAWAEPDQAEPAWAEPDQAEPVPAASEPAVPGPVGPPGVGTAATAGFVPPAWADVPPVAAAVPAYPVARIPVHDFPDGTRRRTPLLVALAAAVLVVGGLLAYPMIVEEAPAGPPPVAAGIDPSPGVAGGAGAPLPSPTTVRPTRTRSVSPPARPPSASAVPVRSPAAGSPAVPAPPTTTAAAATTAAVTGRQIRSMGAGACLHAPAATGQIQLWTCNDEAGQRFTHPSDGTLRVRGKCVEAAGTADGATLRLATCSGQPSQQFDYNASYDLVSLWSVKCVDIPDGSAVNGVAVQIWECTGAAHQKWSY